MTLAALAFAAGAALLQQQAQLPWLAWLALLPLCIGLAALRWRGAAVFALASGFLWAAACAHWRMADWLSPELEGRDLQVRSEEHTSELQSLAYLVCRLLLEKK